MAEFTNITTQEVATLQNVLFTETAITPTKCITHRPGAGVVTLRGIGTQCRARYKAFFNGNVSIPTGGALGAISLALAVDGEALASTNMTVTPAAVGELFSVSSEVIIDVPAGCCGKLSVINISTIPVNVANANLIVERVA